MAPLPPLSPSPPGPPEGRIPVRPRSLITDEMAKHPDAAEIVLAKLRGIISAGAQETGAILGTIAVAAHALAGADGAAIAMPRSGAVICVGRSGETAPDLGVPLNVDSGISGECLRSGTIMRCDDASRDPLVDPEVCRLMGVQSIAVVPLRGHHGRVGVLEVFSGQSYAFTEEHMSRLGRLAGLAEAAWARGPGSDSLETAKLETDSLEAQSFPPQNFPAAVTEDFPPERPLERNASSPSLRLAGAAVALTRVGRAPAPGLQRQRQALLNWRYATMAGAAMLLLVLSVLTWKEWYRASLQPSSPGPVTGQPEAPARNADAETEIGLAWQPGAQPSASPRHAARAAAHSAKLPGVIKTPDSVPDSVMPPQPRSEETSNLSDNQNAATANPATANSAIPDAAIPSDATPAVNVPEIAASSAGPVDLGKALSSSPAMPKLGTPISQGVAGGTLAFKVQPIYPPEARRLHLEGTVVFDATITEHGQIEDLKLVSGDPILARAATDAVSKWRYTPYLLNGKPISKQTRINIRFLAP